MIILGINAFHGDSSACVMVDGKLIAATEEERFNRVKHWSGLPIKAIAFCLQEAGIELTDVDYIGVSRDPKAKIIRKSIVALSNTRLVSTIKSRLRNSAQVQDIKSQITKALGYDKEQVKAKIYHVEHHRCHLASSFFASPYTEAGLLSIDGMGDFSSVMMGYGKQDKIKTYDSVSYPHSLGYLYTAFTQFLGFPHFGDEYKVMGLSSYGDPTFIKEVRQLVSLEPKGKFKLNPKYFSHFREGIKMTWDQGAPTIGNIWGGEFKRLFGAERSIGEGLDKRHKDLAASVQAVTEEVTFHVAEEVYKRSRSSILCLSGGVAQNSVANGKLISNTSFDQLYVPPAAHDAGTSVGAALYIQHHVHSRPRQGYSPYAYTGASYKSENIEDILGQKHINYEKLEEPELYELVTECLINEGVVGWFQGKAEFGPRALGNRSILADPRRLDARDLINRKIKRRENFRPFAPSVLKEKVPELFESNQDTPYMERVLRVKEEAKSIIPAVTHIDGTGRLQTVDQNANRKYYDLINAFYQKTQVPVLLNTSFNENEPIVNTPDEALACFLRTDMDMLVMEDIVVTKQKHKSTRP